MSIPARYDPNRDRNGHFIKRNTASRDHSCTLMQRFSELTAQWFDARSAETMDKVKTGLLELVQQNDNLDVKLKACIYVADRYLGKAVERLQIESDAAVNVNVNALDPADVRQLDVILGKALGPVIDAEVVVKDVPQGG